MKAAGCIAVATFGLIAACAGVDKSIKPDRCTTTDSDLSATFGESVPTATSIKLLSITPTAGALLRKDAVLAADLEYAVQNFEPGRFKILAQFDTEKTGWTTDGTFRSYPVLKTAVGKIHFCFPLMHVWDLPDVTRPFSVRFFLNRVYDGGTSRVLARTETLVYSTEQ